MFLGAEREVGIALALALALALTVRIFACGCGCVGAVGGDGSGLLEILSICIYPAF
jgi:hypothetical protein